MRCQPCRRAVHRAPAHRRCAPANNRSIGQRGKSLISGIAREPSASRIRNSKTQEARPTDRHLDRSVIRLGAKCKAARFRHIALPIVGLNSSRPRAPWVRRSLKKSDEARGLHRWRGYLPVGDTADPKLVDHTLRRAVVLRHNAPWKYSVYLEKQPERSCASSINRARVVCALPGTFDKVLPTSHRGKEPMSLLRADLQPAGAHAFRVTSH